MRFIWRFLRGGTFKVGPSQRCREQNVGPGRAQMWRNCGFVKSKIDGENAADWSKKWCDLQKKKVSRKFQRFFRPKLSDLHKKKRRSSPKFHRFIPPKSSCSHATLMGLSLLNVIWMGPLSSSWAPKNSWAPGSLSSPCPPSRRPWSKCLSF